MLYSLIIPTYNCETYIDDTLRSVLSLLTGNCELIIVDDGSTDNTRQRLAEYEHTKHVTIAYNPHGGASAARNTGIRLAHGTYISFLDCDDRLKNLSFLDDPAFLVNKPDLYIFGIERIFHNGEKECWRIPDRVFPTASDFADAYIRERKFLIYSNGNKLYRRDLIQRFDIRFEEGINFGEDRLFNYSYLTRCGSIVTSSMVIYEYLQRSPVSMSSKSIPGYFDIILKLHKAKTDCFTSLSKDCTGEDLVDFIASDLCNEIEKTIDRFADHPEEEQAGISGINALIFADPDDPFLVSDHDITPDNWYKNEQKKRAVLNGFKKKKMHQLFILFRH